MKRRKTTIAAAITAAILGVVAAVAIASEPDPRSSTEGYAAPRAAVVASDVTLAKAAGKRFLDDFVDPDGRVVRRDQGNDTVSEGQAYGLLIAVAIGDRAHFDAIWGWTQQHLQRTDKLLAFQWENGKVVDANPATDADLDAARALLLAADRWTDPSYKASALEIGDSILLRETIDVSKRKVLVAGPWARTSPAIVNVSYFSPRAYDLLYTATGDRRWKELQDTSLEAIDGLTANAPSLPPDWARVHGTQIVPSYQPSDRSKGVRYSYEAARVMPRYAEMCATPSPDPDAAATPIGRRLVARAWPFLKSQGLTGPTIEYRADGRRIGGNRHPLGVVAAAAAADAAGDTASRDRLLNTSQDVQDETKTYYGSAWVALGRIMLTTDLLGACNPNGTVA